MGFMDAIQCEDRVQLKVSDLMQIMKTEALNWAQNECIVNGLKAHLPHNHMLIMIGEESTCVEKEEAKHDGYAADICVVDKPQTEDDHDLQEDGPVKAKRKICI